MKRYRVSTLTKTILPVFMFGLMVGYATTATARNEPFTARFTAVKAYSPLLGKYKGSRNNVIEVKQRVQRTESKYEPFTAPFAAVKAYSPLLGKYKGSRNNVIEVKQRVQ